MVDRNRPLEKEQNFDHLKESVGSLVVGIIRFGVQNHVQVRSSGVQSLRAYRDDGAEAVEGGRRLAFVGETRIEAGGGVVVVRERLVCSNDRRRCVRCHLAVFLVVPLCLVSRGSTQNLFPGSIRVRPLVAPFRQHRVDVRDGLRFGRHNVRLRVDDLESRLFCGVCQCALLVGGIVVVLRGFRNSGSGEPSVVYRTGTTQHMALPLSLDRMRRYRIRSVDLHGLRGKRTGSDLPKPEHLLDADRTTKFLGSLWDRDDDERYGRLFFLPTPSLRHLHCRDHAVPVLLLQRVPVGLGSP